MANPTKLAVKLATAIGASPSQVQGWIERGLGPAGTRTDAVEHFRHLAPLLGPGRQADVAVLKMAADGYPCRCLRDVLARLARQGAELAEGADELVEHLMTDETVADLREAMAGQARRLTAPDEWAKMPDAPLTDDEREELAKGDPPAHLVARAEEAMDEPAAAELLARSAALPVADLVTGAPVEPFDVVDLDRLGGWEQLGMPAMPLDGDGAALHLAGLTFARESVRAGGDWLTEADPGELARGVAAARVLMDAGAVQYPSLAAWGDEHRWRRIGWLAPVAQPVLTLTLSLLDLASDVDMSPELQRWVRTLEGGRHPIAGPAEPAGDERSATAGIPGDQHLRSSTLHT